MTENPVRVVKVGGSLFDLSGLPAVLERWMSRQTAARHVLVAGGGSLADAVRQADARFGLDPSVAHWICIDLLTAAARLLAATLPRAGFVLQFDDLRRQLQSPGEYVLVFAVADFLRTVEPLLPGPVLPHDWSVTSDSIAARLAWALNASQLVLLKSTNLPAEATGSAAAAIGLVDAHFPIAAEPLPAVRWVNLRDAAAPERFLAPGS